MARRTKSTVQSTVGKSGYALGSKRTDAEWDALVKSTILPALQGGATMQSQREQYGPSEKIRMSLRRLGYTTKGQKVTITPIKTTRVGPKVLVKHIAEGRQAGDSWNTLRLRSGMDIAELKTLLRKHGFDHLADGRVVISVRGKAKLAQAEAAAAAKPARKARARKTVTASK